MKKKEINAICKYNILRKEYIKSGKSNERINTEFNRNLVNNYKEYCNKYGVKETINMFDKGHTISIQEASMRRKYKGYQSYLENLSPYEKDSFRTYRRFKRQYRFLGIAKREYDKFCQECLGQPSISAQEYLTTGVHHLTAEASKKRQAARDQEPDSELHEFSPESHSPLPSFDSRQDTGQPFINEKGYSTTSGLRLTRADMQKRENYKKEQNEYLESLGITNDDLDW